MSNVTRETNQTATAGIPVWTVVYQTLWACWHIEFGHPEGPPLKYETVKKLADKFKAKAQEKLNETLAGDVNVIQIYIIPSSYYDRYSVQGQWRSYKP